MDYETPAPHLVVARAYEPPSATHGLRVLIDRLWPRGLRRDAAAIDLWLRDIAPSAALRSWFAHEPARWTSFVERYHAELDANPAMVERLCGLLRAHGSVTLLVGARDPEHNHGVALLRYLLQPTGSVAPVGDDEARQALRERLLREHARLLELMTDVRLALLAGHVDAACALFDELGSLHHSHAAEEDARLLPRLPRCARWPQRVYEAEHRKLLQLAQQLHARLQAAPARLRDPRRRLRLVDEALPLQHLMEHHFAREEQGLLRET